MIAKILLTCGAIRMIYRPVCTGLCMQNAPQVSLPARGRGIVFYCNRSQLDVGSEIPGSTDGAQELERKRMVMRSPG